MHALPGFMPGSVYLYTKEKDINMAVITIIKTIKTIHPDAIVMVKSGKFYNVYGKDSYVMSYLFEYKQIQLVEL